MCQPIRYFNIYEIIYLHTLKDDSYSLKCVGTNLLHWWAFGTTLGMFGIFAISLYISKDVLWGSVFLCFQIEVTIKKLFTKYILMNTNLHILNGDGYSSVNLSIWHYTVDVWHFAIIILNLDFQGYIKGDLFFYF